MSNPSAPLTPVQQAAEDLAACLCAALSDGPPLCFCGVLPGDAVPIDVGFNDTSCGGMAYVRVTSVYSSVQVGALDLRPGNCAFADGFDFELGVYRPFPLDENGRSPEPDVQLEAMRWQMWDVAAMREAVACCDWLPPGDTVMGQYAPAGPAGGVLGGVIPISGIIV